MDDPWYKNGLRFACQRCGRCCSGFSGTVEVSDDEIAGLARHLGLDEAVLRRDYTRVLPDGATSLREKANQDCVFYDAERGCRVYPVRPRQCRTWPFWPENLETPRQWNRAARKCPGIGRGLCYKLEQIQKILQDD